MSRLKLSLSEDEKKALLYLMTHTRLSLTNGKTPKLGIVQGLCTKKCVKRSRVLEQHPKYAVGITVFRLTEKGKRYAFAAKRELESR